eukprot:TRINITY_DN5964_c0_g1_i2.p1 TRINITY_DN5964_c0_g1~~TRINITY_DN5964_c0_g1_i2.p1  ORF type:complete len:178 (-),score=17.18 TRINITY_DN5964_c0_g1_i2:14-547(-)
MQEQQLHKTATRVPTISKMALPFVNSNFWFHIKPTSDTLNETSDNEIQSQLSESSQSPQVPFENLQQWYRRIIEMIYKGEVIKNIPPEVEAALSSKINLAKYRPSCEQSLCGGSHKQPISFGINSIIRNIKDADINPPSKLVNYKRTRLNDKQNQIKDILDFDRETESKIFNFNLEP